MEVPAECGVCTTFGKPSNRFDASPALLEDVKAGAGDPPRAERVQQRVFVDERPTRCIEQIRGRSHRPQLCLADQVVGLDAVGQMQRDKVRPLEQLARRHLPNAGEGHRLSVDERVGGDHVEARDLAPTGDRGPDVAKADQTERLAVDRGDLAQEVTPPAARGQLVVDTVRFRAQASSSIKVWLATSPCKNRCWRRMPCSVAAARSKWS